MPLTRPIAAEPIPARGIVRLAFPDGAVRDEHLRGGIFWPVRVGDADSARVIGYAVLVGVDTEKDEATVWEAHEFDVIDSQIRNGKLVGRPLAPFLLHAWATYHASRFYWHQDRATANQYAAQLLRNPALQPKPSLVYVPWEDDRAAEQVLWRVATEKRLRIEAGLTEAIRAGERLPDSDNPAKAALVAALVGLTRWPWSAPEEDA